MAASLKAAHMYCYTTFTTVIYIRDTLFLPVTRTAIYRLGITDNLYVYAYNSITTTFHTRGWPSYIIRVYIATTYAECAHTTQLHPYS